MITYTEDYLVEQPAIQLMQHELGWDVKVGILNVGFWILNGRGRREKTSRLGLASHLSVAGLFDLSFGLVRKSLIKSEFLFKLKTSA